MKKNYIKPNMIVAILQPTSIIAGTGTGSGEKVYGNSSASGNNQLSRQFDGWDDDE